jgi:hypothetical protein
VDFSPGAVVEDKIEFVVDPVLLDSLYARVERQSARLRRAGVYDRNSCDDGTFLTWEQISAPEREQRPGESLPSSAAAVHT